ncbi:Maf-like protein [Aurantimonas endophytica]|jgi:septum formation protein|uniref:Nucleoside triphosphate pyrophosphatase n=1 Tax=Aurantimonas endophytica TaxID=1522175 RepID=A0A7W6HHL1_9HYPH|nr:Maf-like protein [Aurantimonas endophytica]MBB4005101.1 septum formation protein [Aurantimonas endophytica]MCO6406234.1 Maf-like protein [Aurantimonas endophytica]
MAKGIVLASSSVHRRELLKNAGIDFTVEASDLDERAIEAPLLESGVSPEDIAGILAEAKATDVSTRHQGTIVIGADQTLSLGDEVLHKPATMEDARRTLLKLSGRTHHLNSAVVLVEDGAVTWRHVATAAITLRDLDPGFIGRYLAHAGQKALTSVGAYQIEKEGIQLMDSIEGDFFTIIGLPLLPLLKELRRRGEIDG